jgi:TonB family protein
MHRNFVLVGGYAGRRIAPAVVLVQGNRLSPGARLGLPLAASLALHAALLSAVGAGEPGADRLGARSSSALLVRLTGEQHMAQATPAPRPRVGRPRYLASAEVDEGAKPIDMPALVYPERAYINRIAGAVRMRVYISATGRVDRADVVSASPTGHFEQAAIEAVKATRFRPAQKNGQPVASQKLIEVEFDPYGPVPEERS